MTAPDYNPEPTDLESALAFLATTLTDLGELVPNHLPSPDETVALLKVLREHRQTLAAIEAYVEAETAKALGKGKHTVAGHLVEVRGGGTWKDWRNDDVAFAICRDIAVDPETGELNADVVPIIDMVRSRLLAAARPSWRTTQLANYGIDPGEYATWTVGRKTVQITESIDATGGEAA